MDARRDLSTINGARTPVLFVICTLPHLIDSFPTTAAMAGQTQRSCCASLELRLLQRLLDSYACQTRRQHCSLLYVTFGCLACVCVLLARVGRSAAVTVRVVR